MTDDTHPDPHGDHFHESAYDGLLEDHHAPGDDSQWAFGTDFEDPLAGVDTTVPEGVDHQALAAYCLMLGDDALVYSHRLSEWCSRAPDLEEDIALANVALDLLGQARLLLARAAAADGGVAAGDQGVQAARAATRPAVRRAAITAAAPVEDVLAEQAGRPRPVAQAAATAASTHARPAHVSSCRSVIRSRTVSRPRTTQVIARRCSSWPPRRTRT